MFLNLSSTFELSCFSLYRVVWVLSIFWIYSPGATGISGSHIRHTRGVRPRLEGFGKNPWVRLKSSAEVTTLLLFLLLLFSCTGYSRLFCLLQDWYLGSLGIKQFPTLEKFVCVGAENPQCKSSARMLKLQWKVGKLFSANVRTGPHMSDCVQ